MILLNLLTSNQEQIDKIIHLLLKNKFATTVILGNPEKAYSIGAENEVEHSTVYKLQFATKSLLFSEIEASWPGNFRTRNFTFTLRQLCKLLPAFLTESKIVSKPLMC